MNTQLAQMAGDKLIDFTKKYKLYFRDSYLNQNSINTFRDTFNKYGISDDGLLNAIVEVQQLIGEVFGVANNFRFNTNTSFDCKKIIEDLVGLLGILVNTLWGLIKALLDKLAMLLIAVELRSYNKGRGDCVLSSSQKITYPGGNTFTLSDGRNLSLSDVKTITNDYLKALSKFNGIPVSDLTLNDVNNCGGSLNDNVLSDITEIREVFGNMLQM